MKASINLKVRSDTRDWIRAESARLKCSQSEVIDMVCDRERGRQDAHASHPRSKKEGS